MVYVARFGYTDDGVDKDVSLASSGSTDGQFSMGSVHGVARLKGHDARPAEFFEMYSKLCRSVALSDIIVVVEPGDGIDLATYVTILDSLVQVYDRWMLWVPTEYLFGLLLSVSCQRHGCQKIER